FLQRDPATHPTSLQRSPSRPTTSRTTSRIIPSTATRTATAVARRLDIDHHPDPRHHFTTGADAPRRSRCTTRSDADAGTGQGSGAGRGRAVGEKVCVGAEHLLSEGGGVEETGSAGGCQG
ncbi:hypothetical protein HKX48_002945, partial [Thoreauomyces humboldtii]